MEMYNQGIRNEEEVPNTHFFVYKNSKYPFNFDFFKHFSKFISENQVELEKTKEINLLDDEYIPNLSRETIEVFIKYVQRETIFLNDENVVNLNYLATKYKVNSLIAYTDEYIANHQDALILDILFLHQREINSITTSKCEDLISEQLSKWTNDQRLLDLDIPTLFRIMTKYALKKPSVNEKTKEIEAFLFQCLDKYSKNASILFSVFEHFESPTETVKTLISKYFDVFDFSLLNPQVIKQLHYEQEKVIAELNEESEKQEIENEEMKKKLFEYENEITKLGSENENKNLKIHEQEDEIYKLACDVKNKEAEIGEMKEKLFEIEEKNKKLCEENETKSQKIHSQEDEIQKLNLDISRLKSEVEECQKLLKEETFPYQNGREFEGIINHLTLKTGGNIHDNSTIEVTTNNFYSDYPPKNLLDSNGKVYYANLGSKDFWICFDFKNMEIEISNYSIKSYNSSSQGNLKNWVIEISKDGTQWDTIDEHHDCGDLNGRCVTKTFSVKPNHFSRFCRLHHTGEFWDYSSNHYPGFKQIEFYGKLITMK